MTEPKPEEPKTTAAFSPLPAVTPDGSTAFHNNNDNSRAAKQGEMSSRSFREHPTISDNHGQLIGGDNSSRRNSYAKVDPLEIAEAGQLPQEEMESLLPRLVLRNRPFGQSLNRIHIQHNMGVRIYSLLKHNWFHVFLRVPTIKSVTVLMSIWTAFVLLFAFLYMWYDASNPQLECGLGLPDEETGQEQLMTFAAAFAFSLETCTTVGYGLPHGGNNFFTKGCGGLQFLIYLQMVWSMLFNAFLLAFLYARLGRSETRSNQVINSRKALVSIVDGQVRFQARLFDADARHPVVEAHVRLYCVMNHRPVPRPLRLLQPDDDMGGMLFLSFPTVVSHHIDLYSLLHPPPPETESGGILGMVAPSGLVLRQCEGPTGNRDDVVCPVCGESYGTLERFKTHVRYNQMVEGNDDYPVHGSHLSLDLEQVEQMAYNEPTKDLQLLKEYFREYVSEVMVVVEGIDPMQSGTFQSLQSYRFEDIVWDEYSQWAPCLTILNNDESNTSGERVFQVDLDRYHDIVIDTAAVEEEKRIKEEATEAEAARLAAAAESDENAIEIGNMAGLTALLNKTGTDSGDELSSPRRPADGLLEDEISKKLEGSKASHAGEEEDTVAGLTTLGTMDSSDKMRFGGRFKRASRRPADGFIMPADMGKPARANSENVVPHPSLSKPLLKTAKSMPTSW